MNLTPRLMTIASMVEKNTIISDVGTDHGYIPVYLVREGICPRAIASDINKGPLNSAKGYIAATGLESKIQTRLGGGLDPIRPGEVEGIVIAGMGGILIKDILSKGKEVLNHAKYAVLQPMVAQDILRQWIYQNGYTIIDEELADEEGRIYEVIKISKGSEVIDNDIYFKIGKRLIEKKHPLLPQLIGKKIKEQQDILDCLEGVNTPGASSKHQQTTRLINKYKEVLGWL